MLANEPEHATAPWFTPSSFHEHDVPLLAQLAVNVVAVVPLLGLIDAEHVGSGADTVTVLELHDLVPPGPVATSVT